MTASRRRFTQEFKDELCQEVISTSKPTKEVAVATMRKRWELASPAAAARGHAGNRRLHERWQVFNARKKRSVVANAAIARELAGWCWSLAVMDDQ